MYEAFPGLEGGGGRPRAHCNLQRAQGNPHPKIKKNQLISSTIFLMGPNLLKEHIEKCLNFFTLWGHGPVALLEPPLERVAKEYKVVTDNRVNFFSVHDLMSTPE